MTFDLLKTEKQRPSDNVILFERLAELKKHQSALSKYLELLRAAKTAKL